MTRHRIAANIRDEILGLGVSLGRWELKCRLGNQEWEYLIVSSQGMSKMGAAKFQATAIPVLMPGKS